MPSKQLTELVRRIRPAPLAVAIANVAGLSKRKTVRTKEGSFFINPVSDLGYHLTFGEYEPSMRAVLQKYLPSGGVFIDLGANEGYFSVLASGIAGPSGKVIAVEPQSRLQSVIQANLNLNQCKNVRLIRAVVSAASGTATLELASEMNTGGSSLFKNTAYSVKTESVQSLTLAELLDLTGVGACDLMKVDVEGAEYDIFMGSESILLTGRIKNIALEIHNTILEKRHLSGDDLHQLILRCGYQLNDQLGNWVYSHA